MEGDVDGELKAAKQFSYSLLFRLGQLREQPKNVKKHIVNKNKIVHQITGVSLIILA
jgi:hypothetical protein